MSPNLDALRAAFPPPRAMLTVEEVARVIYGRGDLGGREAVTAGLRRGDIIPGLRKVGGRWLVPIKALADWLDSLAAGSGPHGSAGPPAATHSPRHPSAQVVRRGRMPDSARLSARQTAQQMRTSTFLNAVRATIDCASLQGAVPQLT